MWVHLRLVRLRGDLSCVQKIVVILAHFACWIPLGHSHDVDGRFKPHLCTLKGSEATSIHLFVDFLSKSCKPKYSLWKTEDTRRSDWSTRALLGPKALHVGTSCVQKIVVMPARFAFWTHLGHPMRSKAASSNVRTMHSNMHLEQQPWLCMAICIPSSMFWVAGGFSSYNTMGEHNHSDRFRDTPPMTLPYLKLN